jgi:hypothetical protein
MPSASVAGRRATRIAAADPAMQSPGCSSPSPLKAGFHPSWRAPRVWFPALPARSLDSVSYNAPKAGGTMNALVITISDTGAAGQAAPVYLQVHLVATLNTAAEQARRTVNREVVVQLGTGLVARDPELSIADGRVMWRVPIVLSLPGLGDVGQVGAVDVDAQTGAAVLTEAGQARIVEHARRLYAGATLQAK